MDKLHYSIVERKNIDQNAKVMDTITIINLFALYPFFLFTLHCITIVLFTLLYLSDRLFWSFIRLFSS